PVAPSERVADRVRDVAAPAVAPAAAGRAAMMRPYGEGLKVYLYREPVDMRKWRNGFAVWHKVIEGREKFCWPRLMEQEVVTLTAEELAWLLDGYDIFRQPHKMLRFKHAV